ncbi:inhibitor of growth protein 1 homolog [Synchiropus splendidus]|uniref:inhibitor of growth protein 1 homolog n=1 Tax=Synchiropus splendidus TaxID=270530 RepID=UPI00237DD3B6|nr:inhibitor of growth protein 1 homolog [Synchiropus splendidus]
MKCWMLGLFSLVLLEAVITQTSAVEERTGLTAFASVTNSSSGNSTQPGGGGNGGGGNGGGGSNGGSGGGGTVKPKPSSTISLTASISLLFMSLALQSLWLLAPFDSSHLQ